MNKLLLIDLEYKTEDNDLEKKINNKRILISNSQNIEISNNDIDLISNIEVLFQVLETLLMQLDIV